MPHHEGERLAERLRQEEIQGPSRQAQRGRCAQYRGAGLSGARPAHARVQRPDARARRRRMEPRLPAHRPAQPGNSGAFRRSKEERGPGRIGLRDPGFPDFRHRGAPYGIRGSEFDNRRSTACSTPSTRGGRPPRRGVPTTTPWTNRPTRC